MSDIMETNNISVQEENRHIRRSDGSHGNYHSALLLVFLLGTLGVALAFVPVLVLPAYNPSTFEIRVTSFTTIVGAVFALSVATTSFCLIIGKRRLVEKRYVLFSNENHADRPADNSVTNNNEQPRMHPTSSRLCKNVHRLQIVLFGIGSALYMLIDLVQVAFSKVTFEEAASTVNCVVNLISLITQIIFFIMYEGALLQNITLLHYAIALMIADKVWVWVSLTFISIAEIVNQPSPIEPSNSTYLAQNVLETSQSFLEPFFIEFLTTCVGILLAMWSLMIKKKNVEICSPSRDYSSIASSLSQEHRRLIDIDNDYTESERDLLITQEGISAQHTLITSSCPKLTNRAAALFFLIAGVGYLISGLILHDGPPLEYVTDSISPSDREPILYAIQITVFGPLTLLCIISAYRIYKNVSHSPACLSPNDYLLLVTTAGAFLWYLFKLIAGIAVISLTNHKVNVTDSDVKTDMLVYILSIAHIWAQSQFLLGAHSVHRLRYPLSKLTQVCLIYLAAINSSEWLLLGLERQTVIHQYSSLNPLLNAVYGDIGPRILMCILYPIIDLYRFHSVVMAYEIGFSKR